MSREGYFDLSTEVKISNTMYELRYRVFPYRQPVIGIPSYGYTIELLSVNQVPAEFITEKSRLFFVNFIDTDIQTEIDERYPDGDFYKEEE
jgi:hypothetical protein